MRCYVDGYMQEGRVIIPRVSNLHGTLVWVSCLLECLEWTRLDLLLEA